MQFLHTPIVEVHHMGISLIFLLITYPEHTLVMAELTIFAEYIHIQRIHISISKAHQILKYIDFILFYIFLLHKVRSEKNRPVGLLAQNSECPLALPFR